MSDKYAGLPPIAAKSRNEPWSEYWQRALNQRNAQILSLLREREELRRLINRQAEDGGLWFVAETIAEAYLQQELRKLHAAIEGESISFVAEVAPEESTEHTTTGYWVHLATQPTGDWHGSCSCGCTWVTNERVNGCPKENR